MLHVAASAALVAAAVVRSASPPLASAPSRSTAASVTPLRVRIDDKWVDLSAWRAAHPAGDHWLDLFQGQDASEVFHAFHSTKTRARLLPRLPRVVDAKDIGALDEACSPVSPLTRDYRVLRAQLEEDGWWDREVAAEAATLGLWALCLAAGVTFSWSGVPVVSSLFAALTLATANTMAGWIAHDYVHGTDAFCDTMRPFGGVFAGLSTTWWSDKHNLHHALTNEVGTDEDLMVDPALWLWPPNEVTDRPWRRWQHKYVLVPFSLLFHIWRIDSLKVAWRRRGEPGVLATELLPLFLHYTLFLAACAFSVPKLLATISLSGLCTAVIVTVSHQAEELHYERQPDWVLAQLQSTRDAVTSNPFSEWIWGGMNYQVEHHLFPTMPRSKYPKLAPILKTWCEARGVQYRVDEEWDILKRNFALYKAVAEAPADPSAPVAGKPAV